MKPDVKILLAEDDDGHAALVEKNLRRAGIMNTIFRFVDGQEILDFFYQKLQGRDNFNELGSYLLLLDIRMPKVDGVQVLRTIKSDNRFKKIPIIMLTTTDSPEEIKLCHELGCSNYITKPVDYQGFIEVIKQLGLFITIIQIPGS